jgi:hypothetical protein
VGGGEPRYFFLDDFFEEEAFLEEVLFLEAVLFLEELAFLEELLFLEELALLEEEAFLEEPAFFELEAFFDEAAFLVEAAFFVPPLFFEDALPFGAGGTLPPSRRASERPMAMACLRLVTFFPEPLFSVPRFNLCISVSTLSCALLPYFVAMHMFLCKDKAHVTHRRTSSARAPSRRGASPSR